MTTLEEKLSSLMPLKYFIFTGYARNALYLLLKAHEWDEKAEVIIPAYTCSIISIAVREAGAVCVPVDAEDNGLNIDPEKIKKAITKNTKAIYVVHTYGTAAKIDEICMMAKKHKLIVIEDLAQSLFSTYKGKQLGTFGDFALLSFTKKIKNFEGGAIGSNNRRINEKMLQLQSNYREYFRVEPSPSLQARGERFVRYLGSLWESSFPLYVLLFGKCLDFWTYLMFKGKYGLFIDRTKFFMTDLAKSLTLAQLDGLYKKNSNAEYLKFRKAHDNKIIMFDINQSQEDTLPAYYTGIPKNRKWLLRLLSFRTWHNCNDPGKYPRADYLFSNNRIFSRTVLLFNF